MERKKLAEFSPPYFTPVLMWPNPNERKNVFAVKKKLGDVVTYRDAITDEWLQVFHASEWKELNDYEKKELADARSTELSSAETGFISLGEYPDENRVVKFHNHNGYFLQNPNDEEHAIIENFLYWEYADEINPKLQGTVFNNTFIDRSDEKKENIPQAMSFDKRVEITGNLNFDDRDPDQEFIDLIKMMLDDFLKYKNSGVLNLAKDIMSNIEELTGEKNIEVFELIESQKKVNDHE